MKFAPTAWILTLSAVLALAATTCKAHPHPPAESPAHIHFFQRESKPDHGKSAPSPRRRSLVDAGPRRLPQEKRDGLLGNLVGDLVTPKATAAPEPAPASAPAPAPATAQAPESPPSSPPPSNGVSPRSVHLVPRGADDGDGISNGNDGNNQLERGPQDQDPDSQEEFAEPPPEVDKDINTDETLPIPSPAVPVVEPEPSAAPAPSPSAEGPTSTTDDPHTEEPTPEPSSDPLPTAASTTTGGGDSSDPTPGPVPPVTDGNNANSDTTTTSRRRPTTTNGAKDETFPTAGGNNNNNTIAHQETMGSGNKMAVTIGVVIAAIIIAGVIGIWIFRKWKLSPSRQFKSKIAAGGMAGGAGGVSGAGTYRSHDDPEEYSSYDDLFRPAPHESAMDMAAATNGPSSVAATAMGATGYNQQQHYSAQDHYQPEHYQQDQYYDPNYYKYDPTGAAGANGEVLGDATESPHSHYQQHMSLSSDLGNQVSNGHGGAEYHAYRYPDESYAQQDPRYSQQQQQQHSQEPAAMGRNPATGHNMHGYGGSEDYNQNNHFLRELRE